MKQDIKLNYGMILASVFFFLLILTLITGNVSLMLNQVNSYQIYELNKPASGATNIVFIILIIILFFSILKHVFHHHEKKHKPIK